ncbi:hypothetical protein [Solilutibacter silvestris]|uniref:hypothetical protein n=1 Tax=Solilutibacter silvestris TaxID=1645665 RepID=UPI00101ADF16|nr:hypothetical protein [Lysobacter silvestris]
MASTRTTELDAPLPVVNSVDECREEKMSVHFCSQTISGIFIGNWTWIARSIEEYPRFAPEGIPCLPCARHGNAKPIS